MEETIGWVSSRELSQRGLVHSRKKEPVSEDETVVGVYFESVERIELPPILRDVTKGKEVQ